MSSLFDLALYAFFAVCISLVCRKAGFSPVIGFLAFIPLLNLILLYYIAFASWPRFEGPGEGR